MNNKIRNYLILILICVFSLTYNFSFNSIDYLLIVSVVAGSIPLSVEILTSLKQGKINLGFPVLITIIILLILKEYQLDIVFVVLILLGQIFKEFVLLRVNASIKDISASLPDSAFIKKQEILEVKISEINKGDLVVIKDGGRAPVDGLLQSEKGAFDISVISGESKPVTKKAGEVILAGSISLNSYIELQATNTYKTSTIAQVQKLISDAQSRSAPLSRFSSRYAEITSIVTLLVVVIVFLFQHDIHQALALWIALVPVVFAIIVPVATTIGISVLAKQGVLIKDAETCESLTKADIIVFDKTGTLTKGRPEVIQIKPFKDLTEQQLLQLTASIESISEHHLAKPIVQLAKLQNLKLFPINEVNVLKGRGISALYKEKKIAIGNDELMKDLEVSIDPEILNTIKMEQQKGQSVIFISQDRELIGIIFLADQLRETAKYTVNLLKNKGYRLIMLTGDDEIIAAKVANELGFTEVSANMLPQTKQNFISKLRAEGKKIIMVGDGINDAPSLAEADIGIAMGLHGVDITLDAANVVLLNDDLTMLPEMMDSSKRIFSIIKQDLVIASLIHLVTALLVINNSIGISGSVILHQISSLLILTNTLRLFIPHKTIRGNL